MDGRDPMTCLQHSILPILSILSPAISPSTPLLYSRPVPSSLTMLWSARHLPRSILTFLLLRPALGLYYGHETTSTTRPAPPTMSPPQHERVTGSSLEFRLYQESRYLANPQWFRQPGRPCDPSRSLDDLFITNRTRVPPDAELMSLSGNYCAGSASPTASIDLMTCRPESRTCDCFAENATWDPVGGICRMLPGGFCFRVRRAEVQCVVGAKCLRSTCRCARRKKCQAQKIAVPDPGPAGDPSDLVIPYRPPA